MNSHSTTSSTYQSEPGGGPADPKATRFVALFVICAIIATVLLLGRAEVSRWYHAKATNSLVERRYEDAVTAANQALEWDPDSEVLLELRAFARMQDEDYEGCIADYDQMIAKAAEDDVQNEKDISPIARKASVLHQMGRHIESVAILNDIIAYRKREYELRDDYESRYAYAMSLNNRAYMVGQAYSVAEDREQFDIKGALEQIRLGMKVRNLDDDSVMIDTLGYLLLLNEESEEAVKELERAVSLTQSEHAAQRNRIVREMKSANDQRPYQDALSQLDKQYSIILHHRGEAYEAVGEQEKAAKDLAEAERLGYNPDKGIW